MSRVSAKPNHGITQNSLCQDAGRGKNYLQKPGSTVQGIRASSYSSEGSAPSFGSSVSKYSR